ncbi:MAG: serpin family protein, partial [Bacteroidales bacterium]|nr:serpin family protein [Bacteroidales bacterium]
PKAVSYLLNAIYFKAQWTDKFKERNTSNGTFTTAEGPINIPLMWQCEYFKYMKNDLFAAVDLPYGNGQWSMTVMLPEKGKSADDVIDYLAKNGTSFTDQMRSREVNLKLPRFETESTTENLKRTMIKMGISRVFGNGAEIPNMCYTGVYISNMLQKARIKVDESGSEAAAVTEEEVVFLAAHEDPPVTFHADHPFVYAIREASTGVILFVGKFTGK